MSPLRPQRAQWFLGAIVLLVAVSRLWQARESLWLDELHTAWTAAASWSEVARRAADGNHSPLFFWIEWVIARTLGASELTLRLPSLVAGALLPVLLFGVTRRWTGSEWLGLLPAWLAAVDPQAIYFGTEARPYALVQLLAVAHIALFAMTMERPTVRRRVALVGGTVLLFYLHYTTILLLAAELTYFAIVRSRSKRDKGYRWSQLAADVAAIALLATGALANIQAVYARRGNWATFVPQRPLWDGLLMVPWTWTALVLTGLTALKPLRKPPAAAAPPVERPPDARALVLCWLVVPVFLAWVANASNVARLLHPRYLATAAPAAFILLALALHSARWRALRLSIGAGLAIAALVVSRIPTEFAARRRLIAYREDDWRGAVKSFNRQVEHGADPVLVRTLLVESNELLNSSDPRLHDYCLYPVTSLYKLDAERGRMIALRRDEPWRLAAADLARVRSASGVWMILGAGTSSATEMEFQFIRLLSSPSGGARRSWEIVSREVFGSVRVLRFEPTN